MSLDSRQAHKRFSGFLNNCPPRLLTVTPPLLCDRIEFLFAALTERVSTNPRSPAPPPAPAEALAPAQGLPVLLLRRQQKDHAAGHQDVPQRVRVVVVALRLCEDVQAHADEGTESSRDQIEDPTLPGGWVAVSPADPPVHLLMQGAKRFFLKTGGI